MNGMNASDGTSLKGVPHLRQRLADILGTPLGSRVMRRDYGSKIFRLVDRPVNPEWLVDCYAWSAEAIDRWETEFKLSQVSIDSIEAGHPTLTLVGNYLPDGQEIRMEGITA